MKSEGSASLSDSIIQQGQLKYLFLHWQGVFNSDNIQDHTMNLSRRRVRFRFQSFYVYSTWYLNQFEFYKRRSAVLKSQSIIEQLRCTDFYKFLNVWLFLNDWLFLNVLMFDHPPPYELNYALYIYIYLIYISYIYLIYIGLSHILYHIYIIHIHIHTHIFFISFIYTGTLHSAIGRFSMSSTFHILHWLHICQIHGDK